MAQLLVAVDPSVGVEAGELAKAWDADEEAAAAGTALVSGSVPGSFVPSLAELVTIPLAVNLASSVVYDLICRLLARQRPALDVTELELIEAESGDDRVVVVRMRRTIS